MRSLSREASSGLRHLSAAMLLALGACGASTTDTQSGGTPSQAPGAPTIGAATAMDGAASIAFTAPTSTGTKPIESYTVTCTAGTTSRSNVGSASPVTVSGLANGTTYSCVVTASSAAGTSAASGTVSVMPVAPAGGFSLSTGGITSGGVLSTAYTCDGASLSPPLAWTSPPSGTAGYAMIMTTIPSVGSVKYNWILYNIPASTAQIAENTNGGAAVGFADDGGGLNYAPPCSQGPGTKQYIFTLYALSAAPNLAGLSANQVTGAALTAALASVTKATAVMTLNVTRTNAMINCGYIKNSITGYATANSLGIACDSTYAYFSTFGIQSKHAMMNGITATNQQVPIAQNFTGTNAWKIPLTPVVQSGTKTSALDGPIGIAVNGIPIFNPCKQGGCTQGNGGGDTKVLGELDLCNGHAGRADDYHYHAAPVCMMSDQNNPAYWDTHPVGWALDGYAIFGYRNPDGTTATRDGVCGGNTVTHQNAPSGYAYHVTDVSPYVLSCFYGVPSPDLAGQASKFSPLRPPGTPMAATNMSLAATATSLAIGGTSTMQWTSGANNYQVRYTRTSDKCWTFVFLTNGATTSTSNYCRNL
jgi:phosphatidylethanolamine-binding protein (PEBP) family uncharacterized protein